MKKKAGIFLDACGKKSWIGGLYYIRNMAFQLSQNNYILKKYNLYLITTKENEKLIDKVPENVIIILLKCNEKKLQKIEKIYYLKKYNAKYIFPCEKNLELLGVHSIAWIADFQHEHLPLLFNEQELEQRTRGFQKNAKSSFPLVLSSQDSYKDFRKFYSKEKQNVYVVPFVSYIEDEISRLNPEMENAVLSRFVLERGEYICISNQFWKHKNHIVVFQAIKILAQYNFDLKFVFTGELKDYRNKEYFETLIQLIKDSDIEKRIQILGFIDRIDQIIVMKNARFLIQPSLFEGWGTVVEDGKVLDKLMLLSDIPIHREQMNENCRLFSPNNPAELADRIIELSKMNHEDDIQKGINGMYERAKLYSKEFQHLLEENG